MLSRRILPSANFTVNLRSRKSGGMGIRMLRHLHIENIAVVKCADIDFHKGFSVLTGETGAGKSVIIDSVKLLTGKKVSRDLIRSGEDHAYCEALFDGVDGELENYFSTLGVECDDGELLICVRLGSDGKTLSKINGKTVTKTTLKSIGEKLISIHGQKDSDALADEAGYMQMLDLYAHTDNKRVEYSYLYAEMRGLQKALDSLMGDDALLERERDMLAFQIRDIDSARLKSGEEEVLEAELKRLENAEKINKHVKLSYKILKGAESGGVISLLGRASGALSQISSVIPETGELSEKLSDMSYEIDDIAERVYSFSESFDGDPTERIDKIQGRLEKINKLKKRYGESIQKILKFRYDAKLRLDEIEMSDEKIEEYRAQISKKRAEAEKIAEELTKKRVFAATDASQKIEEVLEYLDMPGVRFEINVAPAHDLTSSGQDVVRFLVATNPGESKKPMTDIASGGELSRIMLALRSVINQKDNVGCAIYDEVDTGISGKTSRKIGLKLRQISGDGQVICVTHSAQIATLADTHLLISKTEKDGRAYTTVKPLDTDERIDEAARILGGINITEAQRQAARDMLADKK